MKIATAADPNVQQALAATAAASGMAAWWATAADLAQIVFGVPLQVVLAAATGAFAARSFRCKTTYLKALGSGIVWTFVGIFCCQAFVWTMQKVLGDTPPQGVMSGAALIVSAGAQLFITAEMIEKLKKAIGRSIDNIGRNK